MTQNSAQENMMDLRNIAKIANVEVTLSAELGRAKLQLKDAIEYDEGSIITLDKATTDPVDIFVDDILPKSLFHMKWLVQRCCS